MTGPTQTPASKRFLASHNASSSTSVRRSQFLRTPQQSTSSSVNATPLFRRQYDADEEIETSFEEDINGRDPASITSRHHRFGKVNDDNIIDDIQKLGQQSQTAPPSTNSSRLELTGLENPHQETTDVDQFWTPLSKRQKQTHDVEEGRDTVVISSSPLPSEQSDERQPDIETELDEHAQHEDGMDFIQEPVSAPSRFLAPTLARENTTTIHAKTNYKALFQHIATEDDLKFDVALPDAFSPSRRKGKREYIRGGAADTIRNSILQIAGEQMRHDPQQIVSRYMKHVLTDESGRFEIMQDRDGELWMLVHQSDYSAKTRLSSILDVSGHAKIDIKGTETTWKVMLPDQTLLSVASLWDVAEAANQSL